MYSIMRYRHQMAKPAHLSLLAGKEMSAQVTCTIALDQFKMCKDFKKILSSHLDLPGKLIIFLAMHNKTP